MGEYNIKKINSKKIIATVLIVLVIITSIMATIIIKNKNTEETSSEVEEKVASDEKIIVNLNTSSDTNAVSNTEAKDTNTTPSTDTKGVIYLTFDDGPSLDITPKILDILKKEEVKATFFVINYDTNKEDLVKREVEEGHTVGIHGYSHEYKKIYKSEDTYMENVNKLQSKIEQTTGVKTTITRFPGGSSNTVSKFNKGVMTKLTKMVEEAGYKYYDWNVDSDDAGSAKSKKDVYNNVTSNLSKKRSNVVLMHDFGGNEKTLNALENIIKYGKENGYKFEAISAESSLEVHHKVQN